MFTYDLDKYTRDFDILGNYIRQMALGLSATKGISVEDATTFVKGITDKEDFSKFEVNFTARNKHGDRSLKSMPVLDYVNRINDSDFIMSPTMTTYYNQNQRLSLISQVVADDMGERKIVKREGIVAKQQGDNTTASIKNGSQQAIKFILNSWSGASLDKHNTFNAPNVHPTLSTTCRISTALATASVERFLAGKRYYHTPDKVVEDILVTIDKVDPAKLIIVKNKYKLHIPTVDEVMTIIKRSTDYYWWDDSRLDFIRTLVTAITPMERFAVAYDMDFYHLFLYNHEVIHEMLSTLIKTNELDDVKDYVLDGLDGDIACLISNLLSKELNGEDLNHYIKQGDNEVKTLANNMADNLLKGYGYYQDLIEALIRVDHYPIDTGSQNNAIRLAVPLGDTDSTVFTTKSIVEQYYGSIEFGESQEPVADVMVYMVNGVIAHMLGKFTAQMGVRDENRDLLIMKNEYKFPALQLTPVAKTYHALVKSQEGLVFKKPEFELKGSRFHATNSNTDIVKELHNLMEQNLINLGKGIKMDRGETVDIIARVENDIEASLHRKEDVYFKRERIKSAKEYKNPNSSLYAAHVLWNNTFGSDYDNSPPPTYMGYKVPVKFDNGLESWLNSLPTHMRDGYYKYMELTGKDLSKVPTSINVPLDNFVKHGLPKELIPVVDTRRFIKAILDPHYLVLASQGILMDFPDADRVVTDMV